MIDAARTLCPADDVLELTVRGAPRWFSRSAPRYFVPTRNWRVRRGGSEIYPAFRWKARAYRAVLRAWITLGGARFTHDVVGAGRKGGWPLGELLSSEMPALSTVAVSVGIPGPGQKITLRLMDKRGRVLGFAKYADKPYTRTLLANEARMLERLPEGVGPRLARFAPFMEGELLVQSALPGRPRAPRPRLDSAQMDFFKRLTRPDGTYPVSGHPFMESLRERADEWKKRLLEPILEDLDGGEWPVAWMHGDMAPWNMHWWRGTCLAFDWEHGREAGFPYLDAAATLIQVASIIRREDPRRAKRSVSGELRSSLPAPYGEFAPSVADLSALNMLVSWYPPRPPDDYEGWLNAFIEAES
ncbi:MAG: hypothetical protein ACRDSJ_25480 [Rubrobacteraceae bacterium]